MERKLKNLCILSIVFGVISIFLSFVIIGIIFAIIGIVIELYCIKKQLRSRSVIIGMILNAIALIISIIMIIIFNGRYDELIKEFWNGFNQTQIIVFTRMIF